MSTIHHTFQYARDGGSRSYTGKFEITLQEIENGYRCGKICHEDGGIFIGKYYEDASGKTLMVEGSYTHKCGKITHLEQQTGRWISDTRWRKGWSSLPIWLIF
jgi:hypothetical protein